MNGVVFEFRREESEFLTLDKSGRFLALKIGTIEKIATDLSDEEIAILEQVFSRMQDILED